MPRDDDARVRRIIEATWREVLRTDRFGVDDSFFDLGGTSLEALVVVSELNNALGTDVSGIGLFERPTVRAMTELLRATGEPGISSTAEQSRRRGELRRTLGRRRPRDDR